MREALPSIAAAAVIALLVGAAGMYFVMTKNEAPQPSAPAGTAPLGDSTNAAPITDNRGAKDTPSNSGDMPALLDAAKKDIEKLEEQTKALRSDKETLEADNKRLKGDLESARAELKALKEGDAGPSNMEIEFGKWAEIEGLRNANWKELGETYTGMHEMLKEYVKATREGRTPDPEFGGKVRKLNERLQEHLVAVLGKLPSNTGRNGEFTHPANLLNILAGQLQAAGMPLTESQITELKKLGEEFDRRWDELQKGYNDKTWELQKHLDEAELKEWFKDEMFKVTDPKQKAIALPPEIEDVVSFDLYSAGLSLMFIVDAVQVADPAELKPKFKERVAARMKVDPAALDTSEYIFDDWINGVLSLLTPQALAETSLMKVPEVIAAGKAQLSAMKVLADSVALDEDTKKRFRADAEIAVPQVLKQE